MNMKTGEIKQMTKEQIHKLTSKDYHWHQLTEKENKDLQPLNRKERRKYAKKMGWFKKTGVVG